MEKTPENLHKQSLELFDRALSCNIAKNTSLRNNYLEKSLDLLLESISLLKDTEVYKPQYMFFAVRICLMLKDKKQAQSILEKVISLNEKVKSVLYTYHANKINAFKQEIESL